MQTNYDCGLRVFEQLLHAIAEATAVFEDVELQAPMFYASHLVIRAGGFSEDGAHICAIGLQWNLTAPFLQCNCG